MTRALGIRAVALVAALLAPGLAAAQDLDLTGTWHVLVHYTDDLAHDTRVMRWDDRVWVFEREGDRLRWTEYPIVVFRDRSGRFEQTSAGMARIVHGWEPNPGQLQDIADGLDVNTRGSKSKTLRGSDGMGWRSGGRAAAASATFVTYHETWTIDDLDSLPVFTRVDSLGSGVAEGFDGRTQYTTTERAPDGSVLRGSFERDGTRHGTFRMTRSGEVGVAETEAGKAQREGRRSMFMARLISSLASAPEFQQEIRAEVEKSFRASGIDPEDDSETVERITAAISDEVRQGIREGRTQEELQQLIAARAVRELTQDPEFRARIRAQVEEQFRLRGLRPADLEAEVERVTDIVADETAQGLRERRSRASIVLRVETRLDRELQTLAR